MNKEAYQRGFIKAALDNGLNLLEAIKLFKVAATGGPPVGQPMLPPNNVAPLSPHLNATGALEGGIAGGELGLLGGALGGGLHGVLKGIPIGAIAGGVNEYMKPEDPNHKKHYISSILEGAGGGGLIGGGIGGTLGGVAGGIGGAGMGAYLGSGALQSRLAQLAPHMSTK